MGVIDRMVDSNLEFAESFEGPRPLRPALRTAVVACVDSRINLYRVLGLTDGDAHIIRNAGGVVTDDVIRSLTISQRLMGTREIVLLHHTDCGMLLISDDEFRNAVHQDSGIKPPWAIESFTDLHTDLRQSMSRIRNSPFLPHRDVVRGFVFDVATGKLNEVV
jgi:carbonic anhydrase